MEEFEMNCPKCNCKMKSGTAHFSSRSYDLDLFKPAPEIMFCVGDITVDTLPVKKQEGFYCPECGEFVLSFRLRNNLLFEEGYDMDYNDEIDALPQKSCPECGAEVDFDYHKCPECGYKF